MAKEDVFHFYQVTEGKDKWIPVLRDQVPAVIDQSSPVFITVLGVNELDPDAALLEGRELKHLGPLYFDFDSDDLRESIDDAAKLLAWLSSDKINVNIDESVQVYLSGKKGLHVVVPTELFWRNAKPMANLPDIYKEMAKEIVTEEGCDLQTLDFVVYSGRKGRMWRTCCNQRSNGKYKVQIQPSKVYSLTPAMYDELCSYRTAETAPQKVVFNAALAALFLQCQATVKARAKTRTKAKPVKPEQVEADLPLIDLLLQSELGWNQKALQLASYAHAAKMTLEGFISFCQPAVESHRGSGGRYATVDARIKELRNQYHYTSSGLYPYSSDIVRGMVQEDAKERGVELDKKALRPKVKSNTPDDLSSDFEDDDNDDTLISITPQGIALRTPEGLKILSRGQYKDAAVVRVINQGDNAGLTDGADGDSYIGIQLTVIPPGSVKPVKRLFGLTAWQSSGSFNQVLSTLGMSYTGTDTHIRALYGKLMQNLMKRNRAIYSTGREGFDILHVPGHPDKNLANGVLAWVDTGGVTVFNAELPEGTKIEYSPENPSVTINSQLSLMYSHIPEGLNMAGYFGADDKVRRDTIDCLYHFLHMNSPEIVGKVVGWTVATMLRQILHTSFNQFPFMYFVGAAGMGKTTTAKAAFTMWYGAADPIETSPTSTAYAIETLMNASATVPIIIDEFKPAEMSQTLYHQMKSLIREAYNNKEHFRGGGNKKNASAMALSRQRLSAPFVLNGEAIDAEPALLERGIIVQFNVSTGALRRQRLRHLANFQLHRKNLAYVGGWLVERFAEKLDIDTFLQDFTKLHTDRLFEWTEQVDDANLYAEGRLSKEKYDAKRQGRPRPIYNLVVAEMGVKMLTEAAAELFERETDTKYLEKVAAMMTKLEELPEAIWSDVSATFRAITPQWVKFFEVLQVLTTSTSRKSALMDCKMRYDEDWKESPCKKFYEINLTPCYHNWAVYHNKMGIAKVYQTEKALQLDLENSVAFEYDKVDKDSRRWMVFSKDELFAAGVLPFSTNGV